MVYNFADIHDYKKFPSRTVEKSAASAPFRFHEGGAMSCPKGLEIGGGPKEDFRSFLQKNGTVAFLVIRNDSLLCEQYFDGYDKTSIVPSFSMAKSITSILIGCAIDDGLIASVQDPIVKYLPEMRSKGFDKVTIEHLLQMTSGIRFREGYTNPFGEVATFYYGRDLRKAMKKLSPEVAPGTRFAYSSGDTQLLGWVLERALKGKTVSMYLQEKLWAPMDMEYDASWSLDRKKDGLEKTFCCINARARDFAKIGKLYLDKGQWQGRQLVSSSWVEGSLRPVIKDGGVGYYRYQWWLPTPNGDFMAQGILGQFVYVDPKENIIMVRLGKKTGNVDWAECFVGLARAYGAAQGKVIITENQ